MAQSTQEKHGCAIKRHIPGVRRPCGQGAGLGALLPEWTADQQGLTVNGRKGCGTGIP